MFDCLPQLEALCFYGLGHDTVDLEMLAARNIRLATAARAHAGAVADMAMALLPAAGRACPRPTNS